MMVLIFAGLVVICIVILVYRTISLFNDNRGLERDWDDLVEKMAKERAELREHLTATFEIDYPRDDVVIRGNTWYIDYK